MAELKTKKTRASVTKFLNSIENEKRRKDGHELLRVFGEVTGLGPAMWGASIVGFGEYHYKSERSRQAGDWPLTGFSPRKQCMTVYIMPGFSKYQSLMKKLGKHKSSVSCIYINKLEDVDIEVLKQIIRKSVADMRKIYQSR